LIKEKQKPLLKWTSMQNVKLTICDLPNCQETVRTILNEEFKLNLSLIEDSLDQLTDFFRLLKQQLFFCIEYPYVDKVYRNEYYHYYSSKLLDYPRDCIRISFFDRMIKNEDFRSQEKISFLQDCYKGFLVLRPTFPHIIGRSVIAPSAFINPTLCCCVTKINSTVNGIKLVVDGFPHASQDSEMMVCAETTIWSIMEYFSCRYAEYKPVLPHEIHQLLSHQSWQRQVPSQGLTAFEISFAIKHLGFGVKVYSKNSYGEEFENILKSYVESAVPVIAVLQNDQGIGHVVIIIGRTSISPDNLLDFPEIYNLSNGTTIHDFYDQPFEYVMIDDNHPPYRVAPLNNPALHYSSFPEWNGCRITNIVVPLYKRVYMEADEAKRLARDVLEKMGPSKAGHWVIRLFLTSSRSFKHAVACNPSMDLVLKELLINLSMPKFVWVAELSNKDLLKKGLASGMILMDATQPKPRREGVLAYFAENTYFAMANRTTNRINLAISPFLIYSNNLQSF
jgi:hypothetical protein